MNTSLAFIAVAIAVLAVVAMLVFARGMGSTERRLTPLASLALGFIVISILFGDERLIGYSLMGRGVRYESGSPAARPARFIVSFSCACYGCSRLV
jgi:hypothetical protein